MVHKVDFRTENRIPGIILRGECSCSVANGVVCFPEVATKLQSRISLSKDLLKLSKLNKIKNK